MHVSTFQSVFYAPQPSVFHAAVFLHFSILTPASYDRKGREAFLFDRAKRIWIPALVVTFTDMPFSDLIGQVTAGKPLVYFPSIETAWSNDFHSTDAVIRTFSEDRRASSGLQSGLGQMYRDSVSLNSSGNTVFAVRPFPCCTICPGNGIIALV